MPSIPSLTLAEQVVLLCHRKETGKLKARSGGLTGSVRTTMQAALIVELIERERVKVIPHSGRGVNTSYSLAVMSSEPLGNSALDSLLNDIRHSTGRPRQLSGWLSPHNAAREVLSDLIERNIVVERYKTFGPFMRDYRLKPLNLQLDRELRERFTAVFYDGAEPTDQDRLLAALLVGGFLWEYCAPLRGHKAQMQFLNRLKTVAESDRETQPRQSITEGVAAVISALGLANSDSPS